MSFVTFEFHFDVYLLELALPDVSLPPARARASSSSPGSAPRVETTTSVDEPRVTRPFMGGLKDRCIPRMRRFSFRRAPTPPLGRYVRASCSRSPRVVRQGKLGSRERHLEEQPSRAVLLTFRLARTPPYPPAPIKSPPPEVQIPSFSAERSEIHFYILPFYRARTRAPTRWANPGNPSERAPFTCHDAFLGGFKFDPTSTKISPAGRDCDLP